MYQTSHVESYFHPDLSHGDTSRCMEDLRKGQ